MNLVVDLGQSGARIKIGDEVTSLAIAKTAALTVVETLDLIKSAINSQLQCSFADAKSDHLIGAPLTAELYPAGVDPLFKWWHA
jgi:hypothetical protein